MKYILIIIALWLIITIISVLMAINKQKHFNNHGQLFLDMDLKDVISLMGTSYEKKKVEDHEDYEWKIMNKQYRGINDIIVSVKDNKVIDIQKQRKNL